MRHLQTFGNLVIVRLSTIVQMLHWCWSEPRYNLVPLDRQHFKFTTIEQDSPKKLIKFSQRATWGKTRRRWNSWRRTTGPQWAPQQPRNTQRTRGSRNTWNALLRIKRWWMKDILGHDEHHFQGLKDVFDEAIKIVLNKSKPEGRKEGLCKMLWFFEAFRGNNIKNTL